MEGLVPKFTELQIVFRTILVVDVPIDAMPILPLDQDLSSLYHEDIFVYAALTQLVPLLAHCLLPLEYTDRPGGYIYMPEGLFS